jgi:hypothetical protein
VGSDGSGEVDFNFFRQRLTLYGIVRAAFLLQSLDADSGAFTYYAYQSQTGGPRWSSRLRTAERIGLEDRMEHHARVGAKVKLLEGFHLIVDWNTTGYLDTILLPEKLSIPPTGLSSRSAPWRRTSRATSSFPPSTWGSASVLTTRSASSQYLG